MTTLLTNLYNDEAGFIVSAELILVATVATLGVIVGLAEVTYNVNEELEDVGTAVAQLNQGYSINSVTGYKAHRAGSFYHDNVDECDSEFDIVCDSDVSGECDDLNDYSW